MARERLTPGNWLGVVIRSSWAVGLWFGWMLLGSGTRLVSSTQSFVAIQISFGFLWFCGLVLFAQSDRKGFWPLVLAGPMVLSVAAALMRLPPEAILAPFTGESIAAVTWSFCKFAGVKLGPAFNRLKKVRFRFRRVSGPAKTFVSAKIKVTTSRRKLARFLIAFQLLTILSIPGCFAMMQYHGGSLMDWGITRVFVDEERYPSVAGDRVRSISSLKGRAKFLVGRKPLYCHYYEYFNGRANIQCLYKDGAGAARTSVDEDGCKLIYPRKYFEGKCPLSTELLNIDDVISEKELARLVKSEQVSRQVKDAGLLMLILLSFLSPITLPLASWLQLKSGG